VAQWRCATPPTSDLRRAQLHLRIARRYTAGAMLVAVENLSEHAQVTQRLRDARADLVCVQASATPPSTETTAIPSSWQSRYVDRRWELERGPAGDHDEPYQFEAPASEATRRVWSRLLARVQHERQFERSGAVGNLLAL
jgi:hypothetical protein